MFSSSSNVAAISSALSPSDKIQLFLAIITAIGVIVTICTPIIQAVIRHKNKARLNIEPSEICNSSATGDRYIRIAVQNLGVETARNVHVKVCWADGEQIPPIPVSWTHVGKLECDYISKNAVEYADIAIDSANRTEFRLSTYLNATDASTKKTTNDVNVRIIAYADNASLVTEIIRFVRDAGGEMHGKKTES